MEKVKGAIAAACSLFSKVRSAAKKIRPKILKKSKPSSALEPPLPVFAVPIQAPEVDEISQFTPPFPMNPPPVRAVAVEELQEPEVEEISQSTPPLPMNPPPVPVVAVQIPAPEVEEISQSIPPLPMNPILKSIKEQKLGKSVLNIGAPTVIAVLVSGNSQKTLTVFTHTMVSGLCIGCVAIWNGILLKETFPRQASMMEHSGIALALIFLNGLVASFLPREFICLPILCGCCCLLPFLIIVILP